MTTLRIFLLVCSPAWAVDWELWGELMAETVRFSELGNFAAATPVAERAVEQARLAGATEGRLADSLDVLGFLYCQSGAYRLAEKALMESIAVAKRIPNYQTRLAFALDHLAFLYQETGGRKAEVESLRRQAVDIAVAKFGPQAPEVGMLLSRLAISLIERLKYREAERQLRRALRLVGEHRYPALAADIHLNLGAVAYGRKKYSDALASFDRAGKLYRQVTGAGSPGEVTQLISLGSLYLKMGRVLEADRSLEQAGRLATTIYGPEHPRMAEILFVRMQSLRKLGKRAEAEAARDRAQRIVSAGRAEVKAVNSRVHGSAFAGGDSTQ